MRNSRQRLAEKYADPAMFHREMLYLSRDRFDILRGELWELTQAFLDARRRGVFYQNTAFCFNYQRPCPYFALCRSNGNPNVIENFYQRVAPNEELRVLPERSAPNQLSEKETTQSCLYCQPRKRNPSHLADLTVLVYGQTKIGKSTLCSKADGALFLATEPGLNSLDVFQVPILSWDDLLNACAEITEGKHPFKTVIIDTIDNAYKFCTDYILKKFKIEHESDLGYGKGYALVNNEFQRVLTKLAFLPYGLFLVSHAKEIEVDTRTGKYTRIVPTLPDKARKIVLGMVDMVLFCDLEVETGEDGAKSVRRVIRTKPSLYYEAGDRTGRLPGDHRPRFPEVPRSLHRGGRAAEAASSLPKPAAAAAK